MKIAAEIYFSEYNNTLLQDLRESSLKNNSRENLCTQIMT